MKQNSATTAAFLIAPVVPGMSLAVMPPAEFEFDLYAVGWFLALYLLSVVFVLLIGLPIFLLFSRMRLVNWWSAILGGVLGGAAVLTILGFRNLSSHAFVLYGLIGAATGLTFWFVWRLGPEPDEFAALHWARYFFKRS
jgi:hypothetical protein